MLCQQISKAKRFRPTQESIPDAQRRIGDALSLFEDGCDRYEFLVSLGRTLPPLRADQKVVGNNLRDCRGDAWLSGSYSGDLLFLSAAADSDLMAALLAIVVDIYSGRTPEDVLAHPIDIETLGLASILSPHRLFRLHDILSRVRNLAMLARVQGHA